MKQMDAKKWTYAFVAVFASILAACAIATVIVDPYFHYHKPLAGMAYALNNERYMNDGIGRHFDYNAVIIGTSMTHNFKTSEFDALFGVKSVKTPYAGAGYQEISQSLDRMLARNKEVTKVLWLADFSNIMEKSDWKRYTDYPEYLYDDDYINDVSYLLNKSVLYHGVLHNLLLTIQQKESTTFDEYSSFDRPTGEDELVYERKKKLSTGQRAITEDEIAAVRNTVAENILSVAEKYPHIKFYIVIPPYQAEYQYMLAEKGMLYAQWDAAKEMMRMLTACDNIELYCYMNQYDIACNWKYYSDWVHYTAEINTKMLQWVKDGKERITEKNYEDYIKNIKDFYAKYALKDDVNMAGE